MKVAVVIPCYKVRAQILGVLGGIGPEVATIYVVDDKCPEETGRFVLEANSDPRVKVIFNEVNAGVGGATLAGYRRAAADGMDVVVKMDGDGQMDPRAIPALLNPIESGQADYTKGNRFFDLSFVASMPRVRLLGNSTLSFVNKFVSGYWNVMDPTNGYTALHTSLLRYLPLEKIEKRYFFESDLLFYLGTIRAVVADVPLPARYGDEVSNLRVWQIIGDFPSKYLVRFFKRVFFCYFLRDFNIGSIAVMLGLPLLLFGLIFGAAAWVQSVSLKQVATSGTVMLAALPFTLGLQFLLGALAYDVANVPTRAMHTAITKIPD